MGQIFSSLEAVEEYLKSDDINKTLGLNDGNRISYAEFGSDNVNTLFILPGISGNRICIESCSHYLRSHNFRIILIDWPGYGDSTLIKQRSLEGYCDYFEQILDSLLPDKTKKFALYGISAGCIHISQLLVDDRYKERIQCAILASPWTSPRAKGVNFTTNLVSRLPSCITIPIGKSIHKGNIRRLTSNDFKAGMQPELTNDEIEQMRKLWNVDEKAWRAFTKRFFEISKIEGFLETFHVCIEHFHKITFDLNKVHASTKIHIFYGDKDESAPPKAVESFYKHSLSKEVLENNFTFTRVTGGTHDGTPLTQMERTMQIIIDSFA